MKSMNKIIYKIIFIGLLLIMLFVIPKQVLAIEGYTAQRIEQSHPSIPELTTTQTLVFWVKFKNTGQQAWSGMGSRAVTLRSVSGVKSKLYHQSWYNEYTPNRVNPALTIFPQEQALFRFMLSAPQEAGMHWQKFNLFVGSEIIPGGDIEVGIRVVGVAPVIPTPEPEPLPTPTPPVEVEELFWQSIPSEITIVNSTRWENLPQGPEIRVGLLYVEENEKNDYLPFEISTLNNHSYDIYDQNDILLVRNTQGELIEIDYDYDIGRYFINDNTGKRLLMTDSPVTLRSSDTPILKIHSWQNGPFWDNGSVFDNEFRQHIEIEYNPNTQRLWLINKLPMEQYLKGVAEVSDSTSFEFLKTQMVAARTYALFRYLTPKYTNTPTQEPLFTVRSTQADQVYRGYKREQRASNTVSAAETTKGIIATYQNNDPILAYYFAQSDGKTRSSYEAGMTLAPVGYLQPKIDPPNKGKDLRGHGVGLPQTGGMAAANQGANFSQILKYYYSGIDLTKVY